MMILPQDVLENGGLTAGAGGLIEAERLAAEAVGRYSEDGRLWQLHGLLRHGLGDFAGARSALEAAARVLTLAPLTRCLLADCYARMGQVETAAGLYRELARDARCPTALLPDVASGLGSLGEHRGALETCREIVRRDPTHHQAHFGMAFYLRRLRESPRTILPLMVRAFELAPEIPLYRISLAVLLDATGAREDAADLLRDFNPCSAPCRCFLQQAMAIFRDCRDHAGTDRCRPRAREARKEPAQAP